MEKLTHPFEAAGLGKAPFRVVGFEVRKFQACHDAPVQCGGSCMYCGTGIMNFFFIKGCAPDDETFHVGCDCVRKTGDIKLRKDVNRTIREYRREKRDLERAERNKAWKAERTEKRTKAKAEFVSAHPDLVEAFKVDHEIIKDIEARLNEWGEISEKQAALVLRLAAQATERHVAAPLGKVRVKGRIVSCKSYENAYGSQIKGVVKVETPEGSWLAFGSLAQSLLTAIYNISVLPENGKRSVLEGAVGLEVEFNATLEPGKDAHFAFFKRPTKAVVVGVAKELHETRFFLASDLEPFLAKAAS